MTRLEPNWPGIAAWLLALLATIGLYLAVEHAPYAAPLDVLVLALCGAYITTIGKQPKP